MGMPAAPEQNGDNRLGVLLALSGYLFWGVFPLYIYWIREVPALEILAHRVVWSALFLVVIDCIWRPKVRWFNLIRSARAVGISLLSVLFLSANWLIFIWAISNEMALEASLGYFINPLMSVAMAVLILREKLDKSKLIAILFALLGVGYIIVRTGTLPWVALLLAFCFAMYGLLHKKFGIDGYAGLTVETLLALPIALIYFWVLANNDAMVFGSGDWQLDGALMLAGFVTVAPLMLFLLALPLLTLTTIGLLQYVAPTMQFFVSVYILGEALSMDKLIGFIFIWIGLFIYSSGQVRKQRNQRRLAKARVDCQPR